MGLVVLENPGASSVALPTSRRFLEFHLKGDRFTAVATIFTWLPRCHLGRGGRWLRPTTRSGADGFDEITFFASMSGSRVRDFMAW